MCTRVTCHFSETLYGTVLINSWGRQVLKRRTKHTSVTGVKEKDKTHICHRCERDGQNTHLSDVMIHSSSKPCNVHHDYRSRRQGEPDFDKCVYNISHIWLCAFSCSAQQWPAVSTILLQINSMLVTDWCFTPCRLDGDLKVIKSLCCQFPMRERRKTWCRVPRIS